MQGLGLWYVQFQLLFPDRERMFYISDPNWSVYSGLCIPIPRHTITQLLAFKRFRMSNCSYWIEPERDTDLPKVRSIKPLPLDIEVCCLHCLSGRKEYTCVK